MYADLPRGAALGTSCRTCESAITWYVNHNRYPNDAGPVYTQNDGDVIARSVGVRRRGVDGVVIGENGSGRPGHSTRTVSVVRTVFVEVITGIHATKTVWVAIHADSPARLLAHSAPL